MKYVQSLQVQQENTFVSLEVIEKFLQSCAPPRALIPLSKCFADMRKDPQQVFTNAFNVLLPDIKAEGSKESAAAINGLLCGIAIHYGSMRSPFLVSTLEDYILDRGRSKGENVVDFMQYKAGRAK